MLSVATVVRPARFGSAAELAAYASLSVKTIRRLVDAGKVRGRKVGRRLLIPFEDLDAHILKIGNDPRRPIMSACPTLTTPLVPPITPEELARRNAAAVALLDAWEADVEGEQDQDQDQRETMIDLRQIFGPDRVASGRAASP
jgi:excisionase family DNA binding protein